MGFDPAVGAGMFAAEYTFGTVCTATGTVVVNVGEAVAAIWRTWPIANRLVLFNWTMMIGGQLVRRLWGMSALRERSRRRSGTYVVSFMPGAGCGVESSATVTVDESLPIGRPTPEEMCVNAGILNLVADVDGGTGPPVEVASAARPSIRLRPPWVRPF